MARWTKKTLKLRKDHGWTAEPGCNAFVADRGAVRFDIPRKWIIEPGEKGSIKFMDRPTPDDDCTMEMSIFYLNDQIDWSGLAVSRMVEEASKSGTCEVVEQFEMKGFERDGMTVAWNGNRYIDPDQNRDAISLTMMARKWNIQPLITYAYWADQSAKFSKVWDVLLKSLVLGDYIEDPTQRVV